MNQLHENFENNIEAYYKKMANEVEKWKDKKNRRKNGRRNDKRIYRLLQQKY